MLTFLAWFFGLFGFLSLAIYCIPLCIQLVTFDDQNLKIKYDAKWALVTGGSSGIGLALTEKLASQGINVIVAALDDDLLKTAREELPKKYPQVQFRFVPVNLGAMDATEYMQPLMAATQDVDVQLVFNNAGMLNRVGFTLGYILVGFFHLSTMKALTSNLNCNNTAAIHITHHFAREMVAKQLRGAVCFTSSPGGFMASPMACLYSATKGFLTNFATSIAPELAEEGIDVAVVHPSPTNTGFYKSAGLMSTLQFFKKTAVSPRVIADALFSSLGRTVVVDQGYYSVMNRIFLKLMDYTVMSDVMVKFTKTTSDFHKIRQDGIEKFNKVK